MSGKRERVTNEDLAGALDEQWSMLGDIGAGQRSHDSRLAAIERHVLVMVETNRRLLAERQTFLEAIAFQRLHEVGVRLRAAPEAPATAEPEEFFADDDLERYLRELSH